MEVAERRICWAITLASRVFGKTCDILMILRANALVLVRSSRCLLIPIRAFSRPQITGSPDHQITRSLSSLAEFQYPCLHVQRHSRSQSLFSSSSARVSDIPLPHVTIPGRE